MAIDWHAPPPRKQLLSHSPQVKVFSKAYDARVEFQAALTERPQDEVVLFAEDISATFAKRYAVTRFHVLEHYALCTRPCYLYECLSTLNRLKLHFDVEGPIEEFISRIQSSAPDSTTPLGTQVPCSSSWLAESGALDFWIERFADTLYKYCSDIGVLGVGAVSEDDSLRLAVMSCHRRGKVSFHLVCNHPRLAFERIAEMKSFVEKFVAKCRLTYERRVTVTEGMRLGDAAGQGEERCVGAGPGSGKESELSKKSLVDFTVYSGEWRAFRTLHSSKFNEPSHPFVNAFLPFHQRQQQHQQQQQDHVSHASLHSRLGSRHVLRTFNFRESLVNTFVPVAGGALLNLPPTSPCGRLPSAVPSPGASALHVCAERQLPICKFPAMFSIIDKVIAKYPAAASAGFNGHHFVRLYLRPAGNVMIRLRPSLCAYRYAAKGSAVHKNNHTSWMLFPREKMGKFVCPRCHYHDDAPREQTRLSLTTQEIVGLRLLLSHRTLAVVSCGCDFCRCYIA
eukprot:GHVU01221538.1.p1 GENE.GHVU01221538.1~~GHVU01221538.1.p1  ORF type:complete len:509 (+),score=40.40 GHVU01221538.1:210-1736(+)